MRKFILTLLTSALGLTSVAAAPSTPLASDWPNYGNDDGGARFSPLTQITPANVANLKLAWTYHMNPTPNVTVPGRGGRPRPNPSSTATPIEVRGVMFLPTPYGRIVALNATTGKQIWAYALPQHDQPPFRGISYWPGDGGHKPEILFGTIGGLLIALDAKTGETVKGFGDNGIVDLKTPEIIRDMPQGGYGVTAPGSIYKNLIIMGSRLQERQPWALRAMFVPLMYAPAS